MADAFVVRSAELVAGIDRARGDVPRERWAREVLAAAVARFDAGVARRLPSDVGVDPRAPRGTILLGVPRGLRAAEDAQSVPGQLEIAS